MACGGRFDQGGLTISAQAVDIGASFHEEPHHLDVSLARRGCERSHTVEPGRVHGDAVAEQPVDDLRVRRAGGGREHRVAAPLRAAAHQQVGNIHASGSRGVHERGQARGVGHLDIGTGAQQGSR